jgi:acetyl-CoA carboxylase biotin carboxyl carrier protein
MNLQDIKDLMNQFDESTVREFNLRSGNFEMYLSKNENAMKATAVPLPAQLSPEEIASIAPPAPPAPEEEKPAAPMSAAEGEVVTSPIVGTVYLSPAPDQPAFVTVGDNVSATDTLCIVEAMKMMNEIPAGVDGVITEILAINEQVVGIGDPLFRIK